MVGPHGRHPGPRPPVPIDGRIRLRPTASSSVFDEPMDGFLDDRLWQRLGRERDREVVWRRSRRAWGLTLALGLAVVAGSLLAIRLFPLQWGGPNIGGGLIHICGIVAAVSGAAGLLSAHRTHRARR